MKNRRVELSLSQQEISDKIPDMTRANYSHIERGRTEPSIKQMLEIAKVLKVDPKVNFFENICDNSEQKQIV